MKLTQIEKMQEKLIHPDELLEQANQITDHKLYKKLKSLSFWCSNNTLHKKYPDSYQNHFCCFTHVIGLPRHPATNETMALTPYQVDFFNRIENNVKPKSIKENKRQHHFFHINKGRQMGFTEIMLRIMQYYCFSRYEGYNIGIMAATNGRLSAKDQRRFQRLFDNIKSIIKTRIRNNVMTLINNCVIEAFKASEESMTGDTRYKCVLMDESAKWRIVDDTPVFNSVEPILRASGGDLFLVSTPKGPLKTFYDIFCDENSEYTKFEYLIWETKNNLYTEDQINQMLSSATGDPNQEYLGKFTIGDSSIFGSVSKNIQKTDIDSWDEEYEDDNYIEPEDDDEDE